MAPTTTWHRRRPFVVLLLAAIARPASSQLFTPPPGANVAGAFSPPAPPAADAAAAGGTAGFNVATSLLFVGVVIALFLLGFFSAYIRRCSEAATAAHRRGGGAAGAVHASSVVAAAAAAAFASAGGNGGRRRVGLHAAAMEALPVLTYATAKAVKAGRGVLECAVCLAEFADDGEKLRLLPGCCHVFHAACLDVWLAAHVTCPVCRADLADPAVAAAGHVLAADLAAQAEMTTPNHHTVVNVDETPESTIGKDSHSPSSDHDLQLPPETAGERVDRYTLRLPERLKREIEEAKLLRRSVSAVTAPATASSGRWASRTMSAARPSRRWSALLRALSGPRWSDMDRGRRVAPLQTPFAAGASHGGEGDDVEVVVVRGGDAGADMEKYYEHSLTFAGFVIDGDVAAGDWNPEVFQVSTAVPAAGAAPQR